MTAKKINWPKYIKIKIQKRKATFIRCRNTCEPQIDRPLKIKNKIKMSPSDSRHFWTCE